MDTGQTIANLYKAIRHCQHEVDFKFDKIVFLSLLCVVHSNKDLTQTDLVPYLNLTQSSISKHNRKMEAWGLITSTQGERRIEVNITEKGKRLIESVAQILQNTGSEPLPKPSRYL